MSKKKKSKKRTEKIDVEEECKRFTNNELADLLTILINKYNNIEECEDVFYGLLFMFPNLLYQHYKFVRCRTDKPDVDTTNENDFDFVEAVYKKEAKKLKSGVKRIDMLTTKVIEKMDIHAKNIRALFEKKKKSVEKNPDFREPGVFLLMPCVVNLEELNLLVNKKKALRNLKKNPALNHFFCCIIDVTGKICYLLDQLLDKNVKLVFEAILNSWINCITFSRLFSNYYDDSVRDREWTIYSFKHSGQKEPMCSMWIHWICENFCSNKIDVNDMMNHKNATDKYMKTVHGKKMERILRKIKSKK